MKQSVKSMVLGVAMVALASTPVLAQESGSAPSELKDTKAKVGYGIGMNLGKQFRDNDVELDPDMLLRGLKDTLEGKKTLLTETEAQTVLREYQQQNQAKQMEKRRQQGEKNRAEGEKFLADNKAKPDVKVLPSGLQYKVLAEGQGEPPKSNDVVTVNYRGTLIDGTEFDSSYSRGQPATFAVNRVIKGWTEALQLMKPGAKWQLYIPSDLAYGERGSGAKIGANAVLIFEVELVSFTAGTNPSTGQSVTSDIIKVPSKEEMEKGAKPEIIKKEDAERMIREQQQKKEAEKQ